jgi:hypothetical protein
MNRREQLLKKHGVYETWTTAANGKKIIHLWRDYEVVMEEMIKNGFKPKTAFETAINMKGCEIHRSNPGESFRDFMIRLGWIT